MTPKSGSKKKTVTTVIVLLVAFFCLALYCGYRILQHERKQYQRIQLLQEELLALEDIFSDSTAAGYKYRVGQEYSYLAIGNSITRHPLTDFWWAEDGMAASRPENDYFHLVARGLEEKFGPVNALAYNYTLWETYGQLRQATFELLDDYLVDGIDLITVELSENVVNTDALETDFRALLSHVQMKTGAKIIVIDDFWHDTNSEIKRAVCEELDIPFVDLSDIRGKAEYQAGMGAHVLGDDGAMHTVSRPGVAAHPGDAGMAVIAERVLAAID